MNSLTSALPQLGSRVDISYDGNVLRKFIASTTDKLANDEMTMQLDGVNPESSRGIAGFMYVDGEFQSFSHPQGRVNKVEGGTRNEYFLRDHLGNSRVVYSDLNQNGVIELDTLMENCELLEEYHYYPFGMEMEMWWSKQKDTITLNRYRYNGKEQQRELGWDWYNYGARYYDASVARFSSVDRFADKFAVQSPYAYAANNPIKFIDVNGDSIGVNFLNSTSQEAFDSFFATKEGKAFIGQFAAKGQTINGYTFKADGEYHNQGIDLVYSDRDFGEGEENTGAETTGGTSGGTFIGGRLKLGVSINTSAEATSLIDRVTGVTHESFLHVQEYSFDYSDNGKLDFSHDQFYNKTKNNSPSSRHHLMFHYKPNVSTTHPFATKGLKVLESVNSKNNLGYSRTQLWNKLWNFWD